MHDGPGFNAAGADLAEERIGALQALQGRNPYRRWNSAVDSSDRSAGPNDAASRISQPCADIKARYDGPLLSRSDGVYAIGSCFAREVEQHLFHQGARVLSLSRQVTGRPEFHDSDGRARNTYFHRYTPQSLAQDVAHAFDAIPGWDEAASLIFRRGSKTFDFDLGWTERADFSVEAVLARRRGAHEIAAGLGQAACVILTLGLIEAWRHLPTGLWCNKVHPSVLKAAPDEFELCVTSYEQTLACLEQTRDLLHAHGRPGAQLVVTVSPVPLQQTFTDRDIVVANAESKAVLRAAAAAFVRRHDDVHYFPSYETVVSSDPDRAWRPDRVHVQGELVSEIVTRFMNLYYLRDGVAPAMAS